MPENEAEKQKRILRELEGKNIVNYSILLSAWIQTKMERDKTLVTLSAAAIGLLITVLTTVGVQKVWGILLYILAVSFFSITIWSSLKIYELNPEHLEDSLRGKNGKDPKLEKYDKLSIRAFVIGFGFALLIGVTSACQKIILKEDKMINEKQNTEKVDIKITKTTSLKNDSQSGSLNGISQLKPSIVQEESKDKNTSSK